MPSALAFVAGGLLSGIGKGLVLTGKQKYERAMKRFEQEAAQKRALELEEAKQKNRRGLLSDTNTAATERLGLSMESREGLASEATTSRETLASEATRSREKIAAEANISREKAARISAGKATDTTAAEDRIIKRNITTDENGIETVDHEAAAAELEARGFKQAAVAQRRKAKGIADLDIRKRAEEFADAMVDEQSSAFLPDSSDFEEDGGSRTRFRARMVREYIAKNGGEPVEKPATKPAAAGPYVGDTPPPNAPDARKSPDDGYWYIKRDGKWQQIQK